MIGFEERVSHLEPQVINKTDFEPHLTYEQAQGLAEGIPHFSDRDPANPEWRATPVIALDLTEYQLGYVMVKNEADRISNPTGTMKDRAAWEVATLYRDYGKGIVDDVEHGLKEKSVVPELITPSITVISSGNEAEALARRLEMYRNLGVPPPNLLVDIGLPDERLARLQQLYANIYAFDLSKKRLSPADIHVLTELKVGGDITSLQVLRPQTRFYDWLAHEIFNLNPSVVYVPFGSGRLFENLFYWQSIAWENGEIDKDPRLKTNPGNVRKINILGATPQKRDSMADKLTAAFRPFLRFRDRDIQFSKDFRFTGDDTGVHKVKEKYIQEAVEILRNKGIDAEPSAAAALGLYIQRVRENPQKQKPGNLEKNIVLIVNTGRGIDGMEIVSQSTL